MGSVQSFSVHMQGHFSAVTSLDLTPDGWGLLSASRDRTAMLWDLRTHVCLTTIPLYEAIEGPHPALQACLHPGYVDRLSGSICCCMLLLQKLFRPAEQMAAAPLYNCVCHRLQALHAVSWQEYC